MAYTAKYRAKWNSPRGGSGYLYLDLQNYSGSIIDVTLAGDYFDIEPAFENWDTHVIGLRCSFTILNDRANYFDLFELIITTERKFRVRIIENTPTSQTLFEGFINVQSVTHGYLNFEPIYLVASSYLSKLESLYPASLDTLQNITFIDIINEILISVGSSYNIRVNCSMKPVEDTLSAGQTLFNKTGFNTEVFWENETERKNSLEVLQSILRSFNCYLYWWNNYWYIEHYSDLWKTNIAFVEYTAGFPYSPAAYGIISNETRNLADVHSLVFANTSQEVTGIPGYRLIQVKLNAGDTLLLNLLTLFLRQTNITEVTEPSGLAQPYLRMWTFYTSATYPKIWAASGQPYGIIANGVLRQHSYDTRNLGLQMATSFSCTVIEETSITLSFKYKDYNGEIAGATYEERSDLYMRFPVLISIKGTSYFIIYDHIDDIFFVSNTPVTLATTIIQVEATQFDQASATAECQITIPLGKVKTSQISDENYLVVNNITEFSLEIRGEKVYKRLDEDRDRYLPRLAAWGDFKIAASNDVDFNLIEGSINTDFLDKKVIDITLADNANFNYTNGIRRGTNLEERTTQWDKGTAEQMSLVDWLLLEKFRMYNVTRQKITSDVISVGLLRPFSLFTESKQANKKFILTKGLQIPIMDGYIVDLSEYDNETEVTLTDV